MSRRETSRARVSPRSHSRLPGLAAERRDRLAHHGRDAIVLENIAFGGGHLRDRTSTRGGHVDPPPLALRLTSHAQQAPRLGVAQTPGIYRQPQ